MVIECRLAEIVEGTNFTTVLARIVNVAADEFVLNEQGRLDAAKNGLIFYDSFSNSYFSLGEKVGKAWGEGRKFV
ncbi:hypothetical protein SELR_pSRC200300 (plasmid) [Selenomonas ruminantium subsp. lactilytica TAM6421]|uniref:Flavin reductase like domain-containing protein n=1 Tax=Selenomonas ruminantium subsp. lactilytica (strain NBRC 103574 / TAM6421) TaxID=927704 RepID=I0GUX7_SELRL|nr:hypothetical protein SELR_pSRC200300 [Selenomonas ruminantium subsp. lactilytica TAM6421]